MNISEIQTALEEIEAERNQLMAGPNEAEIRDKLAKYEADLRSNFARSREAKLKQINEELTALKGLVARKKFQ